MAPTSLEQDAERFLSLLTRTTNSDPSHNVNPYDVGQRLGFGAERTDGIVRHLEEQGKVQSLGVGGLISLAGS